MIISFLFLILGVYILAICWLVYGFSKINDFDSIHFNPKTKFSIVVPFRDESENLPLLLASFSKLNYPIHLFEVILIDDDTIEEFKIPDFEFEISVIKNIRISNSPKKDAISAAMLVAKNEWIITTDADCVVHKNWLLSIDKYIQNHTVSMIAGAVSYECGPSFLHSFQQFDFTSLQAATIGSFGLEKGFMCNGANFAYTKSFFQELNGFNGNDQIASGDDVFLLQKAMNYSPERVHYLKSKSNIVITKPVTSWKSLFNQRVRWVSKTGSFQSKFGIGLGCIVLITNLTFISAVICFFSGYLPFNQILLFFVLKLLTETVLINKTNQFLTNTKLIHLIWGSLFHPFFSTSVALYSFIGKYEWKGRHFK